MAARLGISLRAWASYERGERVPDADFINQLVQEGWSANWLIGGVGEERGAYTSAEAQFDVDALAEAIEATETLLQSRGLAISPRGKAEILLAMYRQKCAAGSVTGSAGETRR